MTSKKFDKFRKEVDDIADKYDLRDYHAFVYWFIETNYAWDHDRIVNSITDGCHDKGIDAVIVNDVERHVTVIQSKYEHEGGISTTKDSEIKQFSTARDYFHSQKGFAAATAEANSIAKLALEKAFHSIKKGYTLELDFITTHKRSPSTDQLVHQTLNFKRRDFVVYDYSDILRLYDERQRDWTPALGEYPIPYTSENAQIIRTSPTRSWVVTVSAENIRSMVNDLTPERLFRKNVRHFLGTNVVNKAISYTLDKDPENFWYLNNGISILCDEGSIDVDTRQIRVRNPQIVNGCQTAMSIKNFPGDLSSDVMVRVIQASDFEFVKKITLSQNSSNPVKNRDFRSNDPTQIRLKHEFKLQGWYFYIKRGEAFKDELRRDKNAKKTYPFGELSNETVAKCLVAVKDPEKAISKGTETFFSDMYFDIFTPEISTFKCLAPLLLFWIIKDTYEGKKKFHKFKASTFKGRAAYHVLSIICKALSESNVEKWEKRFAYTWMNTDENASNEEWQRWNDFMRDLKPVISEIFEIYYDDWAKANRKSKIEYDSFLERKNAMKDAIKRHNRRFKQLFSEIVKNFEQNALVEPEKEKIAILAK